MAQPADWKERLGIPINYTSSPSSEDEFDENDVVTRATQRRWDSTGAYLLADGGDGAPADLLGSTPPRVRIRNKEKRRSNMDTDMTLNRLLRANRRNTVDAVYPHEITPAAPEIPERIKKRSSMKTLRGRERDMKLDISGHVREHRADSLPSPSCQMPSFMKPAIPALVESCSRFMSLSSKLKCPLKSGSSECEQEAQPELRQQEQDSLPPSRVNFHNTFSMLIKMGNIDKNCRRAISVEEQVWQNERKDLIWLELRARIAGRTLQQQDAYLCAQRDIIPTIVQNIIHYRFVNTSPCTAKWERCSTTPSSEGYHSADETPLLQRSSVDPLNTIKEGCIKDPHGDDERYQIFGCLNLDCDQCSKAVGKALKEVGTLLDSFYNAEALYPSSKAMATHHTLIATQLFNNRLKAMCLWYNIAHHLRLKILGMRRLIKILQWKAYNRQRSYHKRTASDSEPGSLQECQKQPVVKFDMEPSGSSHSTNSDSSSELQQNRGKDEVDRSGEATITEIPTVLLTLNDGEKETPADPTAPIFRKISPASNGTVDTTTSNESGYTSDRPSIYCDLFAASCDESYNVFEIGPMADIAKLKLLNNCDGSPYRHYISDVLKTQGLRKAFMFIDKMRKYILKRAYMTFERYNSTQLQQYQEEQETVFDDTKDTDTKEEEDKSDRCKYENAKNAFELRRYGCWSEETLQMRLPSYRSAFLLLSAICMEVIHDYLCMRLETQPAKPSCLTIKQLMHELKEGLDIATEQRTTFVRNIDTALAGYDTTGEAQERFVKVVQMFDCTIEKVLKQYLFYLTTMSEEKHLTRSFLESEWGFTARLAKRTKCAALLAPHSFSVIVSNQIEGVTVRFREKFQQLLKNENQLQDSSDNEDDFNTKKHFIYAICRQAQSIFMSERELTIQTAQFSRLLATRLKKNKCMEAARAKIFNSLMNARNCIVEYISLTTKKTEGAPWEDDLGTDFQSIMVRVREVLLQGYKLGFEFHKELHRFVNEPACDKSKVSAQRRPSSINMPTRPNRPKLTRSDSIGGDNYNTGVFEDNLQSTTSIEYGVPDMWFEDEEPLNGDSIAKAVCEARRDQDECHGVPEPTEAKDTESEWAVTVARAIIEFAKSWMLFVTERCDRGRGLRPRWASQGLEFLMLACDPCNTRHLSEAEFEDLKGCMDGCISHVIGSRSPGVTPPTPAATPPPPRRHRPGRNFSPHPLIHMQNKQKEVPTPPTPPNEPEPVVVFNIPEESLHSKQAALATQRLDQARDELLRERRAVGRVVESTNTSHEPKLRQVTFRWQRGLKIGAGNFGKVYTVVNAETGQLLAMKEVSIGLGDRRALQKAANELKVLEGITHPHLVRYYGCEIHREEMLIFMELCVEGSLEALLAESGALPELAVRRYTKQLVSAILELHNRQIAHRDIKTGNIFLTNERHCLKLGDFGCAVKIRANTTAAGELQGYVGTQAYMAPEVFMNRTGHGRAADIWSLGCVVTEMASGKRPFSEYDSNYQIMFVVGMGGRPEPPGSLSDEGHEFCLECLQHDPEQRPRAAEIVDHDFLKVKSDEDCHCEPGYLINGKS